MTLSELSSKSVIAKTRGSLLVSNLSPVNISSEHGLLGGPAILNFDIIHSETYQYSSRVTRSPVEKGVDITDHIIREPLSVSIQASVSDTPVVVLGISDLQVTDLLNPIPAGSLLTRITGATGGKSADESTKPRSRIAFEELVRIVRDSGEPVTLTTGLEVYPNMVITDFSIRRDPATGQRLRFSLDLTEVVIVSTLTTEITGSTISAANKKLAGEQANIGDVGVDGKIPTTEDSTTYSVALKALEQAVINTPQ